jgi:hypothetical protein
LKRKITLTKEKNQKNEDKKKKKQCTISLDWKMKLKTNKTFTRLWKKIINKKNKDWIRKKKNTWKITIEGLNRKK